MIDIAPWIPVALVIALLIVNRRMVATIWFRTEDPRTIAVFRICVGATLLAHLGSIAPMFEYLYSGQGVFTGERAEVLFGGKQWSLLYHFDSDQFVSVYTTILAIACAAMTIGLATAVTKWVTWSMLLGLLARNSIDSGGDHVFTCFLFYLCLARCGESYSVDAWIRRKRNPTIVAHRAIPGWPRNLMLIQMIPMFAANGLAKSGQMWRDGDMFYFVAVHPHFRPTWMWGLTELFGTNLFRVMTWVTHTFEILFPLAIVGWVIARKPGAPNKPWLTRALLLGLGIVACTVALSRPVADLNGALLGGLGLALCLSPLIARLFRAMPERLRDGLLGPNLWAAIIVLFGVQLFFVLNIGKWTGVTLCSAILLFEGEAVGRGLARITGRPPQTQPSTPLTYSPRTRRFVAVLSGLHVLAITVVLLPRSSPAPEWRAALDRPFYQWISLTVRAQSWKMFAGDFRHWDVHDLEVALRDETGDLHAIGDGMLPIDDDRVLDRRQKARSNLLKHRHYRAAHAHWVCRKFRLPNGEKPVSVVFLRVTVQLPKPEALAELGAERALEQMEALQTKAILLVRACD